MVKRSRRGRQAELRGRRPPVGARDLHGKVGGAHRSGGATNYTSRSEGQAGRQASRSDRPRVRRHPTACRQGLAIGHAHGPRRQRAWRHDGRRDNGRIDGQAKGTRGGRTSAVGHLHNKSRGPRRYGSAANHPRGAQVQR